MRRCLITAALCLVPSIALAARPFAVETNREWELLSAPRSDADRRAALRRVADLLGDWSIDLAGVPLTAARLRQIVDAPASEPLLRTAREVLRRPVDLDDLLLFLDDLILAGARGMPRRPIVLPPGRARSAGILLHPDDVFREDRARAYGAKGGALLLAAPTGQDGLKPARNGSVVGPRWAARYRQPETEKGRLRALARVNRDFAARIRSLTDQLRDQGAWVHIESTVRKRERGFLIYGCYWLSKAKSARQVNKRIRKLNRLERQWGLRIPIRWRHPKGWRATVRAAKRLAETYSVDYASRGGAKKSDHYDGAAVDFWAVDLPRTVTLKAPDGSKRTFDLSAADAARDLSLTPQMIEWIEDKFALKKLERDYPHWSDEAADES